MITKFSQRAHQLLTAYEAAHPSNDGFMSAITDADKALDAIPANFSVTLQTNPNPATMGGSPTLVFPLLLAEIEGRVGVMVHSIAYRQAHFLDDLVTGINDARPYRAVGAARSLLELSAFVHHHVKVVRRTTEETQSSDPFNAFKAIVSAIIVSQRFVQVTRFNWESLFRGDIDKFCTEWSDVDPKTKATQILSLIDKLPDDGTRAARFFYEMLCDFVHPNIGAHSLIINRAEPAVGARMKYDLCWEPKSDEALMVLVHVIASPIRIAVRQLLRDLKNLQQIQVYYGDCSEAYKAVNLH